MIKTFANKETAAAFQGLPVKQFPSDIRVRIRSKLQQLHASSVLEDLRVPPGNRLESLKGDRIGYTVFGLMTNGASVSFGKMAMPTMLKLLTTTKKP